MPHKGKANELYISNKCSHAKNEVISLTKPHFNCKTSDSKRFERGEGKKKATICNNYAFVTARQTYVRV
jgi:hypothetical protein